MKSNKMNNHQDGKRWIYLNVGGTYFMTQRGTLTKGTPPNSPLHRASANSTNVDWDRDDKGAYLVDRDPDYFRPVLNYLRHGTLLLNKDVNEEAVLREAEYYFVPELMNLLRQRIQAKQYNSFMTNNPDYLTNYINYVMQDLT